MRGRRCLKWWKLMGVALFAVGLVSTSTRAPAAEPDSQFPQTIRVSKTFDGQPFEYRILDRTEKTGCVVYRLRYPSPRVTAVPQNNTIPAEYYVPSGLKPDDPKRPAVICLHILDGNIELVRLTCSVLASHGIPSILFLLPYYGERSLPEGPEAMAKNPRLFLSGVDQALYDVKRTVDVLASRPEVAPEHIGITGISLGGIVAASAARLDPRISRAVLILAGGDLPTIIHHARETRELSQLINRLPAEQKAEVEAAIDLVDPLRDARHLRDRAVQGKVLMVNAAEDEVIPPACTRKLADALGIANRVVWLNGLGHYTAMAELPRIMQMTAEFFAKDLPDGLKEPPVPTGQRTPLQTVVSVVQQATAFLTSEPADGRCHVADLDVTVTPKGERTYEGHLLLIRGSTYRFKLQCKLPMLGELAVGQGSYPWMASLKKTLFKGTQGKTDKPGDPLAYADARYLTRLRMLGGVVSGLAMAPDLLDQLATLTPETTPDGRKRIRIDLKKKSQGTLLLSLKDDQATPDTIAFDIAGVQGTITARSWQTNTIAHAAMFEPPDRSADKEVDRDVLYRIFSAMFNFAMENAL
jgi:dienelactone hydrolase